MSFRTVTKPHMKKTVVTTVRARPVFRGTVSVDVLVMGRFMGSRASITDFAGRKGDMGSPARPGRLIPAQRHHRVHLHGRPRRHPALQKLAPRSASRKW